MTGACPAWGWGRKALKAQPSSATRGRAQDRSASNGVASRFNVRSARNSFRRPQIHQRAVGKLTSVTICRELRHSDQTIASEHGGTDRRRKNRSPTGTFAGRSVQVQGPRMTGACPAWGWGRKALKAQPSSATRGRAQDRSASNGVASRFNVRSARNSFRRPQIHQRAVGKLTSVTICRELRHSDQTIASEHGGTDRLPRKLPWDCLLRLTASIGRAKNNQLRCTSGSHPGRRWLDQLSFTADAALAGFFPQAESRLMSLLGWLGSPGPVRSLSAHQP